MSENKTVCLDSDTSCNPPDCLPNDKQFEIEVFQQIQCKVDDPAQKSLKQISFSSHDFFINCPGLERVEYQNITYLEGKGQPMYQ